MITILVDGSIRTRTTDEVTLKEVQEGVGGIIECVPYFIKYKGEHCQAWCDEEGKLKGYEVNKTASNEWYKSAAFMRNNDVLVGDIVILTGSAMLD